MCECDKGFYNFFSPYIATIDGCFATCDITGDNSECNRNQLCEVKNFFPECVCKEGFTGEQCDERITTTTMATTSAMTTTIRERGLPRLALTAALGIPAFIVVTAGLLGSSYYG
ncbi:uncharacterized protein LOC133185790 [Saccostrea echinata]|uniref:uncharacterized protein LOC133185790 n=1 Tax=Saccostrea echinata TaxID=191078 RepID=UPI002A8091A9|nr:uncharacterized protein LOC133185790 [Saccostrea echinata]